MENGKQTAFACCNEQDIMYGLTKREYIAISAMQGMLASGYGDFKDAHQDYIAELAVKQSDALLSALASF